MSLVKAPRIRTLISYHSMLNKGEKVETTAFFNFLIKQGKSKQLYFILWELRILTTTSDNWGKNVQDLQQLEFRADSKDYHPIDHPSSSIVFGGPSFKIWLISMFFFLPFKQIVPNNKIDGPHWIPLLDLCTLCFSKHKVHPHQLSLYMMK